MSFAAGAGPSFTDVDLAYVRSALQAARVARQAHGLVEADAHEPRLREAARRGQLAHDDDIARIISLLGRWQRPEVAPGATTAAAVTLLAALEPSSGVAPGRAQDLRLVTVLSTYAEAVLLVDRDEMVEGLDAAARDLAEDHIRAAARHLSELRSVLEPELRPGT